MDDTVKDQWYNYITLDQQKTSKLTPSHRHIESDYVASESIPKDPRTGENTCLLDFILHGYR